MQYFLLCCVLSSLANLDNVHPSDDLWAGGEVPLQPIWPHQGVSMCREFILVHNYPFVVSSKVVLGWQLPLILFLFFSPFLVLPSLFPLLYPIHLSLQHTQIWPHADYPLIPVGKMVLNRNPKNYFAEVEQIVFEPSNMPPGIEPSPDKMLQVLISNKWFSYVQWYHS